MSPFLDPNDPHYSDTPDVSLHPLEGEKNVRSGRVSGIAMTAAGPNATVSFDDSPDRPYIDMLDPADPPSPLTAEDGVIQEGSLTTGGNVIGPKAWALMVTLSRHDDYFGAVEEVIDEAATLASSPAPAGLDTFRRPRYRWTADGMTLDPAGPYVLNHMVPPLDPALVDEHHVTTDDQLRAATRPAEDGRHKPYGDGYCVCRRPWPCEFATRPAEDAGERP